MQNFPDVPWKEWAAKYQIVWRQRDCEKCNNPLGNPKAIFIKNRKGHSFYGLIIECQCGNKPGSYKPANNFTKRAMLG